MKHAHILFDSAGNRVDRDPDARAFLEQLRWPEGVRLLVDIATPPPAPDLRQACLLELDGIVDPLLPEYSHLKPHHTRSGWRWRLRSHAALDAYRARVAAQFNYLDAMARAAQRGRAFRQRYPATMIHQLCRSARGN